MLSVQNMFEKIDVNERNVLVKTDIETLAHFSRLGRSPRGCRVGF